MSFFFSKPKVSTPEPPKLPEPPPPEPKVKKEEKKKIRRGRVGRQTILTSPLGITEQANTLQKTLLGE